LWHFSKSFSFDIIGLKRFKLLFLKADLLVQYGGVSPKMAQEAHAQVIDGVSPKFLFEIMMCKN
jgi:hypothetical protein